MGQDVEIIGIHDQVRGGGNQHLRLSDYHLLCGDPVSVDDGLDLLLPSTSHCWDDQRRVRDDDCAKNRHIHSSLHRCKQRIVPSSELVKPASQFLVRRFRTLRSLQQLLGFRYSGVPLIHADLPSLLSGLQTVVSSVILLPGRSAVRFSLSLLTVSAHLPAGALQLAGGDIVAVAGVVLGGQQEVLPTVVALPRRVAQSQAPLELCP